MAGFGDIAPAVEVVNIRGAEIKVQGLPAEDYIAVGKRFQDAVSALGEGASVFQVMAAFPDSVGALLAAGLGQMGNADVEAEARRLVLGDQAVVLVAIVKATFAEGTGPFVKIMKAMGINEQVIQRQLTDLLSPSVNPSPESTSEPLAA